jgi:hypothetical protein
MQLLSPPRFASPIPQSAHEVYKAGQPVQITWTNITLGQKLSVVLYQLTPEMASTYNGRFPGGNPPFEFITHDQINETSATWIVGTARSLAVSNVFAVALWADGGQITDDASRLFNISAAGGGSPSTSSGTGTGTGTGTGAGSSTSGLGSPSTGTVGGVGNENRTATTQTPSPETVVASSGLSPGASAGIGIGIVAALILGVVIGWFLGRRRDLQGQHRDGPVEVAVQSPGGTAPATEHAQDGMEKVYYGGTGVVPVRELDTERERAEMSPDTATKRFELHDGHRL